jgi:hypothetical protein
MEIAPAVLVTEPPSTPASTLGSSVRGRQRRTGADATGDGDALAAASAVAVRMAPSVTSR